MLKWIMVDKRATLDHLGFIPSFVSKHDERPACDQFNDNYQHGGGWRPMNGFKMLNGFKLKYPGDPVLSPLACAKLRDETIIIYPYGIVAIVQSDGNFAVSHMD